MADRVAEDNGNSEALNLRGSIDRLAGGGTDAGAEIETGVGTGVGTGVCSTDAMLRVAEAIWPRKGPR